MAGKRKRKEKRNGKEGQEIGGGSWKGRKEGMTEWEERGIGGREEEGEGRKDGRSRNRLWQGSGGREKEI